MRRPVAVSSVLVCSLAVLLGAASGPAQAWSTLGHQLVGELAQRHLAPATRAEVARLLAGEQRPTLAGVADWADRLRDLDPERFKATSRWHYVNTQIGRAHVELQSLMRISYAVFCLKQKTNTHTNKQQNTQTHA